MGQRDDCLAQLAMTSRLVKAYCKTPLVPSSLGRGTSLRALASDEPAPWGVREDASRRAVMGREAAALKGTKAVVGLTRRAIEAADRDDDSIPTVCDDV